jgi:hypothetical protein
LESLYVTRRLRRLPARVIHDVGAVGIGTPPAVEIDVGTGGAENAVAGENDAWAASQKRIVSAPGVLKLTLHDTRPFAYLNTSGTVLDSGSYAVH